MTIYANGQGRVKTALQPLSTLRLTRYTSMPGTFLGNQFFHLGHYEIPVVTCSSGWNSFIRNHENQFLLLVSSSAGCFERSDLLHGVIIIIIIIIIIHCMSKVMKLTKDMKNAAMIPVEQESECLFLPLFVTPNTKSN